MKITKVMNPVYSHADKSQIDCIIECHHGQIPFTARADDPEAHGQQLFKDLQAGRHGAIAPFPGK